MIARRTSASTPSDVADVGNPTSATQSALSTSATYYWHVRAVNGGGTTYANGVSGTYWNFSTVPPAPGSFARSAPSSAISDCATGLKDDNCRFHK